MYVMMKTIEVMERTLDDLIHSGHEDAHTIEVIGEVIDIIKDAETIRAMRESDTGYTIDYSKGHVQPEKHTKGMNDLHHQLERMMHETDNEHAKQVLSDAINRMAE